MVYLAFVPGADEETHDAKVVDDIFLAGANRLRHSGEGSSDHRES